MDAEATEQAVVAQATIEALSTEQAESQSSREELDNELATTVAEATNVAAQVEAQATEQAALQAQATENAESGVNAQGTSAALENQVATSQAQVEEAQATSDAAQNELLQAQEQVQLNSLNPNAIPVTIQVDLEGVISGDDEALEDAREELGVVLDPFLEAESCRLGFVLISSRSPDIGQGIQLSDRIATMIEEDYTAILPDAADGGDPALASESIALPGTTPTGEVQLLLFMSSGCQVEG